jgi:hypothetical protein
VSQRASFPLALSLLLAAWQARAPAAQPDYLPAIRSVSDFELLSTPSTLEGEVERTTKFLFPASADPALLGPVFQNVNKYPLHFEFMKTVFPERFPNFTQDEYRSIVEQRATRKYFAGSVSRLKTPQGILYGFTVFTVLTDPAELLSAGEVHAIYDALAKVFDPGPLFYAPDTLQGRLAARDWQNPGFPIYLGSSSEKKYQAYTRATSYGRVRIFKLAAFEEANQSGLITWQDILVIDQPPRDIEGVVGGVITGEPQTELSHVAIRTARRGTPNAYLAGAIDALKPLEGKLIRLEVRSADYTAVEAPLPEAEAWWRDHRPRLSETPVVDGEHGALDSLEEMDLSGAAVPPEARFGGKATNFARLQRLLTGPFERYREVGFGIPMRYYLEFIRSNKAPSPLEPGRQVTYEAYLTELFSSPEFQSDPPARFQALQKLRNEMEENGVVDSSLVSRLTDRIRQVFGSTSLAVRFRSSSNVEDALEFNGAGLYSSTGACADDDLDRDDAGPSRCDPNQAKERRISRALKRVWSSLWTFRAYEERAYYQIQQEKVAMAVLVSTAFLDEKANGVAFTGNPSNALDRRYVVTSQVGEESVVSPDPAKTAEKDILEADRGAVTRIERAQRSSLAPPGTLVLSEASLKELASILWHLDQNFPLALAGHRREEVLFDMEFKIEAAGNLAVKQVRPFLISDEAPAGPTFELEVPPGTVVCGVFVDGREPRAEYEVKSQVRLAPGKRSLPTASEIFSAELVEEALFGPKREQASRRVPGRFRLQTRSDGKGNVTYSFAYTETFSLPGGEDLELELSFLDFPVRQGEPPQLVKTLDQEFLTKRLVMFAVPGGDRSRIVRYSSCSYETLPRWEGRVELEGGGLIRFEERYLVPLAGSGPANLVAASLSLEGAQLEVRDYWQLVYAAKHHNEHVRYWIVLDPPLPVAGVGTVQVVEVDEPQGDVHVPAQAAYLDSSFKALERPKVLCYQKALDGQLGPCGFKRGDADSTGRVNITDAIFVLSSLFAGGTAPPCPDAADFNDDGVVEITDSIIILTFLFRGVDLSAPPGPFSCGPDPTPDFLAECRGSGCN